MSFRAACGPSELSRVRSLSHHALDGLRAAQPWIPLVSSSKTAVAVRLTALGDLSGQCEAIVTVATNWVRKCLRPDRASAYVRIHDERARFAVSDERSGNVSETDDSIFARCRGALAG